MTTEAQTQGLIPVSERPRNAETPLSALSAPITPAELFFIRSNFDLPVIDRDAWRLEIAGRVGHARTFSLRELAALPHRTVTTAVECAGNGRKLMSPLPAGTAWHLGAVSTGTFTGVALRDVLDLCGLADDCVELAFEGADYGVIDQGRTVPFKRSLTRERALHEDTLLAWELNGAPLAPDHGFPVRLLVPGWYGVASVKWLVRIEALAEPFTGHFQTERYIYVKHAGIADGTPVSLMNVRALITAPAANDAMHDGRTVRGVAWSGFGSIRRVWVCTDGLAWREAQLTPPASPYAFTQWELDWQAAPGEYEIIARAEDSRGNVQPLESVWNELGYGNNAVHRIRVTVR